MASESADNTSPGQSELPPGYDEDDDDNDGDESSSAPHLNLVRLHYHHDEALSSTSTPTNIPITSSSTTHPQLTLVFDQNSVLGATLYSQTGASQTAVFRVSTSSVRVSKTNLCDIRALEERVVATIKRRDILPDVVLFAHRGWKAIKINKWLRKWKGPGRGYVLQAPFGDQLIWKSNKTYRLALYPAPEEHQPQSPIANHKPIIAEPPHTTTIALVLRAGLPEELELEIITSFLVLEHRLRMMEKDWEVGTGKPAGDVGSRGFFVAGL